jgi:hypothetical protein
MRQICVSTETAAINNASDLTTKSVVLVAKESHRIELLFVFNLKRRLKRRNIPSLDVSQRRRILSFQASKI